MATIADIIGGSKVESLNECAVFIQMANVMKCSVDVVRSKVAEYGKGYIYTPNLVMPDTPRSRQKLTDMYGEVVIILSDGAVIIRNRDCKGRIGRKQKSIERKVEMRHAKAEIEARREKRKTERMFEDGKGVPSPKRQGKCHYIQCNYVPASNYDRFEPKSHVVFQTIHVNI